MNDDKKFTWIDGRELPLEGKAFEDVECYYDRLPARAATRVTASVWRLQRNCAGMQFRFKTDSSRLRFRWTCTDPELTGKRMSPTGKSGIDVYRRLNGEWRHVEAGFEEFEVPWTPNEECIVYLPTHNGIESFSLGVDEGAKVLPPSPRESGVVKPVVFYGTSITQGGCCTRAGNSYVNIVGRQADVPIVNLGFSGSGCMEDEICDYVAEVDVSCYLLDAAWNMDMRLLNERWERFARKLHEKRPEVPVIFVEPVHEIPCRHNMPERAAFVRGVYEKLKTEDPVYWRNLTLLPAEGMLPRDGEATVDGIHPNDWGMLHMAKVYVRAVKDAIAFAAKKPLTKNHWPFAIMRSFGLLGKNPSFSRALIAAQDRHPGLIDEVWSGCGGNVFTSDEELERNLAAEKADWVGEVEKRGITYSIQQGLTLGHAPDGMEHCGFTDDDWAVTASGIVCRGMLCPTSPKAYEANRRFAERIMTALKPASYWPDDDLRYSKVGDRICFCPRCIAAFNKQTGGEWTRETLSETLLGKSPDRNVREAWLEFHRENLGKFARAYREAADAVLPDCRLGIQLVQSYADYNGHDYIPLVKSLAGAENRSVGLRPGACAYEDRVPRDILRKALYVMNEAARSKNYGAIGQICYELENYPHVSAEKNPVFQMVECSLAIAAGCDSLALYWGAENNLESDENYAYFFDTFAKWKPFLMALSESCRNTEPCGIAEFRGSDESATDDWYWREDVAEIRLMENALPMSVPDANVEAYWLTARRVAALSKDDLERLFAKPVLLDNAALAALKAKFPNFEPKNAVVVDDIYIQWLWTGPKRKETLDKLDALIPGRAAARLLTGGYAVTPIVRTDKSGQVKGVYLLNISPGDTPSLEVAVRRPASDRWCVKTVDGEKPIAPVRVNGDELIFKVPSIPGWRPIWIEAK